MHHSGEMFCLRVFFRSPDDGNFHAQQHKHPLEKGLAAGSSHSPASVGDTGCITTCPEVDLGFCLMLRS